MEVFVLHILKLNIIAAIVILLVKLLARPLKNKVSARWKYFIWMFVVLSLLIPIRLPAAFSIVDFKVQQSVTESGGQRKGQTAKVGNCNRYFSYSLADRGNSENGGRICGVLSVSEKSGENESSGQ